MGCEAVKAINENLLTCECVRVYVYARDARVCARLCVNWGGRWKSGEEWERKWGREWRGWGEWGAERKSMENEGEGDGREREGRNEKAFTLCKKGRAEGKVGKISRKQVLKGNNPLYNRGFTCFLLSSRLRTLFSCWCKVTKCFFYTQ